MAVAEGGSQAGAGLLSAIGQDPDGDGGGASRGGDPGPDVLGLLQQQAGLIVERGPSAGRSVGRDSRCWRDVSGGEGGGR
jgi:hypothetical protein